VASGRIRTISVAIKANISDFEKKMKSAANKLQRFGSQMTNAGRSLTMGITAPILAVGAAATKMAMDAVESEQLFSVSMGKMEDSARKWSERLSDSLGVNAYEIRKNVGTFNVMFKSMEVGEAAAYEMSKGLTELANDIASFYNISTDNAFDKLQSGMVGMSRPLQDLGIIVNETTTKGWAMTNGLIRQGQEMTEAQKVIARYAVIMERTSDAQGDLARTMDSPTNKLRILKSQIQESAISLGQALLPSLNKLLNTGKKVIDFARGLIDKFNQLPEGVKNTIITIVAAVAALGPAVWMVGKFSTGLSSVLKILPKLATPLGGVAAGIAAIVAAMMVAYNTDEELRAEMTQTWSEIKSMISENQDEIDKFVDGLRTGLLRVMKMIVSEFVALAQLVTRLADAIAKAAKGDWSGAGKSLVGAIEALTTERLERAAKQMINPTSSGKTAPAMSIIEKDEETKNYLNDLKGIFNSLAEGIDSASEKSSKFTDKIKSMVDAIRTQTRAFADFTGIFDVFQRQSVSGERLLNRLRAQVSAMGEWQQAMSALESRDINKNLLEQVRAMGPQAVDQVKALARLNDAQLAEYNQLFTQRTGIAGEQAEKVVARETRIDTMIENQILNINVESSDARKIANDIVRELRMAGVPI
jgi:TP901 family phage tail tape measure protein